MESFRVNKLNSKNFGDWTEDMKVVLMENDYWGIVSGTEVKPDEKEANLKEVREFERRRDRAYSLIYLSIEPDYRSLILQSQDPAEAWKLLKNHFRPNSRAYVIRLLGEFFDCRIHRGEDIGLYAARLKNISMELRDVGSPLSTWYESFQLIRSLPPEYSDIIQIIYGWDEKDFTFEKILDALRETEAFIKLRKRDRCDVVLHSSSQSKTSKCQATQKNTGKSYKRNMPKKQY